MTRATTTGNTTVFDAGDGVSIYAWTGSATAVAADKVVNGVVNTLGADGTWTPATPMLWADMVTPHYFLGIYPARTVTDFTADPYTVDNTDYEQSDLLVARQTSGLTATQNPVSLTFDHAMAKLYVNMNFRNQWDAAPEVTSCEATAAKTCTIDYLAKTYAAGEQDAVALTAKDAAEGYARSFSGLMIPQTGFRTVTLTIGGQAYVYTHAEDIPLEAGKYTIVNLIVGRNKIELGEVSINDWTEGSTISGGQALQ
ncbi:fimbrillin family protein [Prevotella sp. E13-27]|uniref:fimbrillin family protein n=1 Tax=Prevotella sp. E13-27 TaxID=2938122 RepID=UPI00200A99D2|nr:fimbrillin family protein [Prevotella sp. E13-27]MCK8623893.1 fimbrillin family protein [Prevotella sp. E13-27]